MTTEQMRLRLREKYPSDAWAKKVRIMSDDQVQAIFLRLQNSGAFDKPDKPTHIAAPPRPHIFYCNDCETAFIADNPDTKECRYCGSTHLTNRPPYVKIKKEKSNEN